MKKLLYFLGGGIASAGLLFGGIALASQTYMATTAVTASATTTVSYMTAGTATTTLIYDALADNTGGKADSAVLLTQFVGSTTASVLGITMSYAQGMGAYCDVVPTACDWYSDTLVQGATTTPSMNLTTINTYSLSALGNKAGGGAGTASTTLRALNIQTPTRYVRAVYTMTTGNGAIWAQIVPSKQR